MVLQNALAFLQQLRYVDVRFISEYIIISCDCVFVMFSKFYNICIHVADYLCIRNN